MNIILIGAPGAGKGTQAERLSAILNIPHISTGDIFREEIAKKTYLGIQADKFISKGRLVPDEITLSIVKERINHDDCKDGFILDGFPRTLVQAEEIEKILKETGKKIDFVINIVVNEDILIKRLTKRRVCPKCNATYNLDFINFVDGLCPKCGVPLIQRDDDKLPVIKLRFISYHELTEPLLNYYSSRKMLKNVISEHSIEDTLKNTLEALGI